MVEAQYAKALFELSQKCINDVNQQFDILYSAINQNAEFLNLISSPALSKAQKKEVVKKVAKDFEELFINFMYVLIDNNRFNLILKIHDEFKKLIMASNNILEVEVYSPSKLTASQHKAISEKIASRFSGKNIVIKNIEEPSLIGGIQIVCDGHSLDISLKNKLDQLKAYL